MTTQIGERDISEFKRTSLSDDVSELHSRAVEMDVETFEELDSTEQNHVLWELSRDIPFNYARTGRADMRRYLAGGVVPRCKVPTVLFNTFSRIREFRQKKGRAWYKFHENKRETTIKIDFSASSSASMYGVTESDVSHELMHTMLRANRVHMPFDAYTRDGRTDRAAYHSSGFPNWDFGGKDKPVDTYLHLYKHEERVASDWVLEEMLSKRLSAYEENGLYEGPDNDHARDGRENPFSEGVVTGTLRGDKELFLALVEEANIAWYTTAKAFSKGYEEVARNSIFKTNYTATNPDEMLCIFHEFFQTPGSYSGTHATIKQAIERHPWLLKQYIDCFRPHPDKARVLKEIQSE